MYSITTLCGEKQFPLWHESKRQINSDEIVERDLLSKEKYPAFETFCKEVLIAKELTKAIEEEEQEEVQEE